MQRGRPGCSGSDSVLAGSRQAWGAQLSFHKGLPTPSPSCLQTLVKMNSDTKIADPEACRPMAIRLPGKTTGVSRDAQLATPFKEGKVTLWLAGDSCESCSFWAWLTSDARPSDSGGSTATLVPALTTAWNNSSGRIFRQPAEKPSPRCRLRIQRPQIRTPRLPPARDGVRRSGPSVFCESTPSGGLLDPPTGRKGQRLDGLPSRKVTNAEMRVGEALSCYPTAGTGQWRSRRLT